MKTGRTIDEGIDRIAEQLNEGYAVITLNECSNGDKCDCDNEGKGFIQYRASKKLIEGFDVEFS